MKKPILSSEEAVKLVKSGDFLFGEFLYHFLQILLFVRE